MNVGKPVALKHAHIPGHEPVPSEVSELDTLTYCLVLTAGWYGAGATAGAGSLVDRAQLELCWQCHIG
jgi:hypothetical protein